MSDIIQSAIDAVSTLFTRLPDPVPIFNTVRPWLDAIGFNNSARVTALNSVIMSRAGAKTLDNAAIFNTVRPWLDDKGFTRSRIEALDAVIAQSVGGVAPLPAPVLPPQAVGVATPDKIDYYVHALEAAAGRKADGAILAIAKSLVDHGSAYALDHSKSRLADIIAQTCHETGAFTKFEENLHYSAKRLMQVWPGKFPTLASALPYAFNPNDPDASDEALAVKVYGSRGGNEKNGINDKDGWHYRGRGPLQLTFFDNYKFYGDRLGIDLIGNPDLAADPYYGMWIAMEFYKVGKVFDAIDRGDTSGARKITNGSVTTPAARQALADVNAIRARVLRVL